MINTLNLVLLLDPNIVIISKYKNIFANGYTPNWSEEVFLVKKLKILCRGYVLMEKKLLELFTKKNCKIKKIGDKLYIKWKEQINFFNSYLDEKDKYK